jgi:hypothetical protein
MKYARIENGVVMEVIETDKDISTLYTSDLIWIPCDNSVDQRQRYVEGKFLPALVAEPIAIHPTPTLVEQILASPDDLAALKKALGI